MTVKEAKKNLKTLLFLMNETNQLPNDYAEEVEIAISALEKQIPKKPTDIATPVVTWGICPVCKGEPKELGKKQRVFIHEKYCRNCGQALEWSDEE